MWFAPGLRPATLFVLALALAFCLPLPNPARGEEEESPPPPESSPLLPDERDFLKAVAFMDAGKIDEAVAAFAYLAGANWPLSEAAAYEAMRLAAPENPSAAGRFAERLLKTHPQSVFAAEAARLRIAGLLEDDRPGEALTLVEGELATRREEVPGPLSLLRARALFGVGRSREAMAQSVTVAYENFRWKNVSPARKLIKRIQRSSGLKPNPPSRERMTDIFNHYFDKGWFITAGTAAGRASRLYPGSREALLLKIRGAGCLIYRNRWGPARKAMKKLASIKTESKTARAFLIIYSTRAGTRARHSISSRIRVLEKAAELAPGTRAEGEARFTMGKFAMDDADFISAAESYQRAAAILPGGWLAKRAKWRAGFAFFLAGRADSAVTIFSQLHGEDPTSKDADKYLYWWARAAEKLEVSPRAESLYLRLVRDYPRTYYGLAAESRLEKMGYDDFRSRWAVVEETIQTLTARFFGVPVLEAFPENPGSEDPVAGEKEKDLAVLRHFAVVGPAASRGAMEAMLLLGASDMREHALRYVKIMADELEDDPATPYYLSIAYSLYGKALPSIKMANRAAKHLRERTLADPHRLVSYRQYPLKYFDLIEKYAGKRGLDPYLILALIKQESAFQARAHSWAGARGLMQVIPSTARYIARKRGLKKKYNLYKPETSLDFGTWYFNRAFRGTGEDVPRALAGYNAGPGRATRWWGENTGRQCDEVIERIPFDETRYYVKIILRNWEMYSRLYGDAGLSPEREKVFDLLSRVVAEAVPYKDD